MFKAETFTAEVIENTDFVLLTSVQEPSFMSWYETNLPKDRLGKVVKLVEGAYNLGAGNMEHEFQIFEELVKAIGYNCEFVKCED